MIKDHTLNKPYRSLQALSAWIVIISVIFGVLGVIGGIIIAIQTGDAVSYTGYTDVNGIPQTYDSTTHPYVVIGIAVMIAAVVQAIFMAWIGQFGKVTVSAAVHQQKQLKELGPQYQSIV